jgi:hypothetical protein
MAVGWGVSSLWPGVGGGGEPRETEGERGHWGAHCLILSIQATFVRAVHSCCFHARLLGVETKICLSCTVMVGLVLFNKVFKLLLQCKTSSLAPLILPPRVIDLVIYLSVLYYDSSQLLFPCKTFRWGN